MNRKSALRGIFLRASQVIWWLTFIYIWAWDKFVTPGLWPMVATIGVLGGNSRICVFCFIYVFHESLKRTQGNFPERPHVTIYILYIYILGPKIFFFWSNDGAMVSTNGGIRCTSQRYVFCLLSILCEYQWCIRVMWSSCVVISPCHIVKVKHTQVKCGGRRHQTNIFFPERAFDVKNYLSTSTSVKWRGASRNVSGITNRSRIKKFIFCILVLKREGASRKPNLTNLQITCHQRISTIDSKFNALQNK